MFFFLFSFFFLHSHRSPDFDTGADFSERTGAGGYSDMNGLLGWNNAGANTFKLELHCGDALATSIFASGLAASGACQTTQQHWIRVDKYKYRMQRQVYNKKSGWACKCARPRGSLALGGVTLGSGNSRYTFGSGKIIFYLKKNANKENSFNNYFLLLIFFLYFF